MFADATDPDGDTLTTTFEWTDENGTVLATTAELFLDSSIVGSGDELTCSVMVDDGFGGTFTDSSVLTLSNTATKKITDLVISNDIYYIRHDHLYGNRNRCRWRHSHRRLYMGQ